MSSSGLPIVMVISHRNREKFINGSYMKSAKLVFIFGKCGSGKSTLAKALSAKENANLFSGGSMLRYLIDSNQVKQSIIDSAQKCLVEGIPFNREIIRYLIEHNLMNFKFPITIFDGFPRNIDQVNMIPYIISKINPHSETECIGISLIATDILVISRIISRANNKYNLDIRSDDFDDLAIQARLLSYKVETISALDKFRSIYPVYEFNSNQQLDIIVRQSLNVIN